MLVWQTPLLPSNAPWGLGGRRVHTIAGTIGRIVTRTRTTSTCGYRSRSWCGCHCGSSLLGFEHQLPQACKHYRSCRPGGVDAERHRKSLGECSAELVPLRLRNDLAQVLMGACCEWHNLWTGVDAAGGRNPLRGNNSAVPPAHVCTCDVHETYPVVPDEVLVLFGKWIGQPLGIHCRLSSAVLCLLLLLLAPSRLASTTHGK